MTHRVLLGEQMTDEDRRYHYPDLHAPEPVIHATAVPAGARRTRLDYAWRVTAMVEQLASLSLRQALAVGCGMLVRTPAGSAMRTGVLDGRWPSTVRYGGAHPLVTVVLDHPLEREARVVIAPYTLCHGGHEPLQNLTLPYVMWQIARAYVAIYNDAATHGVWGRALAELWFDQIDVSDDGRQAVVIVGA